MVRIHQGKVRNQNARYGRNAGLTSPFRHGEQPTYEVNFIRSHCSSCHHDLVLPLFCICSRRPAACDAEVPCRVRKVWSPPCGRGESVCRAICNGCAMRARSLIFHGVGENPTCFERRANAASLRVRYMVSGPAARRTQRAMLDTARSPASAYQASARLSSQVTPRRMYARGKYFVAQHV